MSEKCFIRIIMISILAIEEGFSMSYLYFFKRQFYLIYENLSSPGRNSALKWGRKWLDPSMYDLISSFKKSKLGRVHTLDHHLSF